MQNSQVHPIFQPILNTIFPDTKGQLKEEIKAKILALQSGKNMYIVGMQAIIKNDYDFDSAMNMVKDYCRDAERDITACLGKELIDLILQY
jgi:hypothetical protein